MRRRDTALVLASWCLLGAAALAPSSGASTDPAPTSAEGDVAVTTTTAKANGRSLTLAVTCAATSNSSAGCSGGRVVIQRSGKVQSSGGKFDDLANGATVKVKLTISASLGAALTKRKKLVVNTQTLTTDSDEEAGLIRPVTLKS